jgi:muconolactone delta-isomerase
MKYLTVAKPGPTPIPRERGVELLQAAKEWIITKLADGSLDCVYNFFGGGGFAIGNADSHEALLAVLLSYPMYPFFDWEVEPILEFSQSIDQYIESYQ